MADVREVVPLIGHLNAHGHNNRNVLTASKRYNNTSPPATTNEDSSYHRQFVFDNAGNWDWFQLGSDPNTPYVPDNLNLYASINDPSDPETPTESFTYDQDQNLTEACGTGVSPVRHAYDAENRLIEVLLAEDDPNNLTLDIAVAAERQEPSGDPATPLPPQCQGLTADDKKLLFTYDYLNRRVRKLVYAWTPGPTGPFRTALNQGTEFTERGANIVIALLSAPTGVGSLTR